MDDDIRVRSGEDLWYETPSAVWLPTTVFIINRLIDRTWKPKTSTYMWACIFFFLRNIWGYCFLAADRVRGHPATPDESESTATSLYSTKTVVLSVLLTNKLIFIHLLFLSSSRFSAGVCYFIFSWFLFLTVVHTIFLTWWIRINIGFVFCLFHFWFFLFYVFP